MSGSNIFDESKLDSSSQNVPLSPFVSYKNTKASRFSKGRESDYEKQEKYFENNNGEVYLNQAKCLVYRVSINKFAKAVFTEPFINALKQLQKAAKNPNRESSKRVRKDFIREYGTHFFDKCFLGASITTITRMSHKSKSQEEQNERKNCVSDAFTNSKGSGVETGEIDIEVSGGKGPGSGSAKTKIGGWGGGFEERFGNRSQKCDKNRNSNLQSNQNLLSQSEVLAWGAKPFSDRDTWIRETSKQPSPVDFRLASIANLMNTNNLKDIPGEKLDANLLKNYIQDTMENYCDIMLGAPCPVAKGCHIWNDCDIDEICVDDGSSERGFFCRRCQCQESELCQKDKSLKQFNCVSLSSSICGDTNIINIPKEKCR